MFISLLTDFGLRQEYAAVCKAVIVNLCPSAHIVDISHNVSSFDIEEGAFMLKNFVTYSPVGVHVVVIDPGVGTERRGIIIETERGDFLVGPDNGVLQMAARFLQFKKAVILEKKEYMLPEISSSFHGRDIFSPVGAYLAKGVPITEFGNSIEESQLYPLEAVLPHEDETGIYGKVLRIDKFGNIQTTIPAHMVPHTPTLTVRMNQEQLELPYVTTFGDVAPETLLIYRDSDQLLTISQNLKNAAETLKVKKKMEITILK